MPTGENLSLKSLKKVIVTYLLIIATNNFLSLHIKLIFLPVVLLGIDLH